MNINVNDTLLSGSNAMTPSMRQNQKEQQALVNKISEIEKDNSKNIYQKQADLIRENRNLADESKELENEEKKIEQKKIEKQIEDKVDSLSKSYDPEIAKMMIQSSLLMQNTLAADQADIDPDTAETLADATEEVSSDISSMDVASSSNQESLLDISLDENSLNPDVVNNATATKDFQSKIDYAVSAYQKYSKKAIEP